MTQAGNACPQGFETILQGFAEFYQSALYVLPSVAVATITVNSFSHHKSATGPRVPFKPQQFLSKYHGEPFD